ncbi:hypothetical protein JTE90_011898 [Oedothorax gibbosus]|uniref:Uncharacterized protein n=1 Tax=Oedothorax gibbosus TaxID=931172 RepID=A0AAV6TYC7_9ARAC|nr:hypothetical protein JTE90_011898 [Oedothorax gibbosus]
MVHFPLKDFHILLLLVHPPPALNGFPYPTGGPLPSNRFPYPLLPDSPSAPNGFSYPPLVVHFHLWVTVCGSST